MTKRVNAKKNKWLLISILSLLCLLMSAVFMCVSFCDERKSQAYNKSVVEDAIVVEKEQPKTKDTIPITVDFIKLKKRNKDIIAWLYCEDTQINYPVVQSADNEYYLRRLIDGTWAVAGTLFFDYRNSSDVSDWYTVIYGHNMHNDTMFGSLHKFSDADYLKKHPNMSLFTQSSIFKNRISVRVCYKNRFRHLQC